MIALISLYFWFLPFSFALSPSQGIDLPTARLAAAVLILLWAFFGLVRKKFFITTSSPALFLTAFLLVTTLSFTWAINDEWAWRKILFLWSFLPLYFVLSSVVRNEGVRKKLITVVLGSAFLIALVGIGQFFLQFLFGVEKLFQFWTGFVLPFFLGPAFSSAVAEYPSLLVNISGVTLFRASAFFPDPHIFSFYLGMAAPLALAFAWQNAGWKRILWFSVFGVLLLADLLTFSRGGYVGLIVGLCSFIFIIAQERGLLRKHVLSFFAASLLLIFIVFFTPFGDRIRSSFSTQDTSNQERLRLWEEAVSDVQDRPFFGVGLGNYPLLVRPSATLREPIYAHNLYLDIALETGYVGLFFFLGFVVTTLWALWRRWHSKHVVLDLATLVSLVVFLGHSLFENPLFSVQVLPLLLFLAALAAPLSQPRVSAHKNSRS